MRKRFKIKNLIRNNRYTFLSRGEEKNLLANEMSLQILGGGWTSPLLHSWGALKKYGARLMCGSNEPTPTRISKFAGSLRNSALPLGEGQTKSGGHSPLLHIVHPLRFNGARYTFLPPLGGRLGWGVKAGLWRISMTPHQVRTKLANRSLSPTILSP